MENIEALIKAKEPKDEIDFTVEGQAAWSMSKMKTANQCPLKYYLQYVIKFKHGVPVYSLITDVGKAAHRILEFVIMGKSISDSFAQTRKEFGHMPDSNWETHVSTLEMSVISFRERMDAFEKNHPVKRFVQEQRIGVTRDYESCGFFGDDVFFRGVLDLGIQTEENDAVILDHKTGAPSLMGIRNFKSQLDIYKILFHKGIHPIKGAQAGIHFVKDGEILLDEYVTSEEIDGKLVKELEHHLTGTIEKVREIGYFKHIRGPHCSWCDFNTACKEGKLLDIEKKTVRFFKK